MAEPCHTPVPIVPKDVRLELTTVEFSVVPVSVPAAAVAVQLPPNAQADPLTVVEALMFPVIPALSCFLQRWKGSLFV